MRLTKATTHLFYPEYSADSLNIESVTEHSGPVLLSLMLRFLFLCPCDCSRPQRYGLGGHRERLRGPTPAGHPQHIRPLDTHPLAGGPTDAGYVWRRVVRWMMFRQQNVSLSSPLKRSLRSFLYLLLLSDRSSDRETGGEEHRGDELLWAAVSHYRWPSAYWQGVLLHQRGAMWVVCRCAFLFPL